MTTTTRRMGASAIALALASSAFVAPSAFAQETEIPAIESGAVNWPIKESFNNYVVSFAKGSITPTEGVEYLESEKSFDFAVNADESELDAEGNGTLQLDGSIHYEGHAGGLDLKYSDIKVNIANGTEATITADYHVQGALPGQPVQDEYANDAEIASFELDEALVPESEKEYAQTDLQTSFLQGAVDSLLNYPLGPVADGNVDVSVTFAELAEETPEPTPEPTPDPEEPGQSDKGSDDSNGSSDNGGIIAAIIALLAAVGAAGAAVGGFIPGFDINKILKQFGL